MPDRMPEDMPDKVPECLPEHMPEDMPDRMPDRMPEDMSEYMPEDTPDRMPEDMSDRMPEDMPDRMPEDLPVRKCINVMVGITRSKVILYAVPSLQVCKTSLIHYVIIIIDIHLSIFILQNNISPNIMTISQEAPNSLSCTVVFGQPTSNTWPLRSQRSG